MKHTIALALLGLSLTGFAHAGNEMGQCLYPKVKYAANGNLLMAKTIFIYAAPDLKANKQVLTEFSAYTVTAVAKGGWVRLTTVPDYDQPNPNASAGRHIGWGLVKDFDHQAFRNCN